MRPAAHHEFARLPVEGAVPPLHGVHGEPIPDCFSVHGHGSGERVPRWRKQLVVALQWNGQGREVRLELRNRLERCHPRNAVYIPFVRHRASASLSEAIGMRPSRSTLLLSRVGRSRQALSDAERTASRSGPSARVRTGARLDLRTVLWENPSPNARSRNAVSNSGYRRMRP